MNCPLCGAKPTYVGVNRLECPTPGCENWDRQPIKEEKPRYDWLPFDIDWSTIKWIPCTLLALAGLHCAAPDGEPAQESSEWYETAQHVDDFGYLAEGCIDTEARYVVVPSVADWYQHFYPPGASGFTSDDNTVYALAVDGKYSVHFILRHEFQHVLLRCAGIAEAVHRAHVGPVWDGLRGTDPGDR